MSSDRPPATTVRMLASPLAYAETVGGPPREGAPPDATRPGRHVGPYKVVRELGHGGMGAVYLAVRDDDHFHQEVALKLLRGNLSWSPDLVARFLDERQILASLDHPGIVRLLDGGSTDDGMPYIVMECVEGLPITQYCEERGLSVRERLELFQRVCAAVQYAHQRLVIHRDLTPRNILVTRDGTPKLLDFGIAKLIGDGPREAETREGHHLLTPEYGSPEQARGEPISVASDVYSLGAILYELLSGARAHQFDSQSFARKLQIICERDPPRPSEAAPPERRRAVAGDLDNIVLKALHKEAGRRYGSVEQLAEDLRRHLVGLPVAARAGTWAYRAGKLVRRHRGALALAVLVVAALGTATVYSLAQARLAHRRFNDVHRLASTLLFEIDGKGATTARELIVSRALRYLDVLAAEGSGDADLAYELARGYVKVGGMQSHVRLPSLGRPRDAMESYGKALGILTTLRSSGHDDARTRWALAEALFDMGYLYRWEGQHARARAMLQEGMSLVDSMAGAADFNHSVAALGLFTMWTLDKEARALPAMTASAGKILELAQAWVRRDGSAEARYWLAMAHKFDGFDLELAGDPAGAGLAYRDAIVVLEQLILGEPDSETYRSDLAQAYWSLGRTLGGRGDPELWLPDEGQTAAAESALRKSLAMAEGLVAKDSRDARTTVRVAATLANLAAIVAGHDQAEALSLYGRSAAIYDGFTAEVRGWSYTRKSEWFLACSSAEVLARAARPREALAAIARGRELVDPVGAAEGASYRDRGMLLLCRSLEARARVALGDAAAAEQLALEVGAGLAKLIAAQPEPITPYIGLVEMLRLRADVQPARRCALLDEAVAVWRSWPGAATDFTRRRLGELEQAASGCP